MTPEGQYPLDPEKIYFSMDELTLDTEEGPKTLRMGAWLNYDPVRIHRMIVRDKTLQVDTMEVLNPLVSKLRRADPDYYKKVYLSLGNQVILFQKVAMMDPKMILKKDLEILK